MQPAPKFVQPAPKVVQPAPKFVQPAPKFVQPAPKFVQPKSRLRAAQNASVASTVANAIPSRFVGLEPGSRLDRYTLVAPVGEGGQAAVWRIQDPLNPGARIVAKLVQLDDTSPADAERVRAEARALARLSHPSLIACHALFEDLRANVLGLVLDEVDGQPLASLLSAGKLTIPEREALLGHIAKVLAYVHGQGLVHRDLKPENILVCDGFSNDPGRADGVKLVDFGIAVPGGNPRPLTRTGFTPGTVPFMPPEHLDPTYWNAPASVPAGDVWAFGVLGWLMLSGGHPTGLGPDATIVDFGATYRGCIEGRVPWPVGSVGGAWGGVLPSCLSLRAAGRLADGSAILARLSSGTQDHHPAQQSVPGPVRTEPMGWGPVSTSGGVVSAPTVPMRPASAALRSPGSAISTGASVRSRRSGLAIGTAVIVTTLMLLVVAWPLLRGQEDGRTSARAASGEATKANSTPITISTVPIPTHTRRSAPAPARPELPSTSPASTCSPCCGGSDCVAVRRADGTLPPNCTVEGARCAECSSRFRTCVPDSCGAPLGAGDTRKLRLSYVADVAGNALWRSTPLSLICIEIVGRSRTCFPASALVSRGGTCGYRPVITTDDITSGRVSVSVDAPGHPHVSVPLTHATLGRGGLCIGWLSSGSGGWIKTVGWFLDPPSDSDEACQREEDKRPQSP